MNVLLLLFLRYVECVKKKKHNNIDEFSLTSSCINCLFLIKWICLLGKEEKWYSFSSHLSVSSSSRTPTRFLIWAHRCGWDTKGKEIRESHSTWISPTIICENNKMLLARFYLERITFSTSRYREETSLEERRKTERNWAIRIKKATEKKNEQMAGANIFIFIFFFFEFRRHLIRTRVSISHQKERSKKKKKN